MSDGIWKYETIVKRNIEYRKTLPQDRARWTKIQADIHEQYCREEMKELKREKWNKRINHTVVYIFVLTQIILSVLGPENLWGKLSLVICFVGFIYVITRE